MASEQNNIIPMTWEQIKEADEKKLTTRQVAEYFGVSIGTVRLWIIDGAMNAETINTSGDIGKSVGRYYVTEAEIDRIDSALRIREVRLAIRKKLPRMLLHRERGERY